MADFVADGPAAPLLIPRHARQRVAFVVTMTNAFAPLGIRLIRNLFDKFQDSVAPLVFAYHDLPNLNAYLPRTLWLRIRSRDAEDLSWLAGTENRFARMIAVCRDLQTIDYVYHIDADTDITRDWDYRFLHRYMLTGVRHWQDEPRFACDFWGGPIYDVLLKCATCQAWAGEDRRHGIQAPIQDCTYTNRYLAENDVYELPRKLFPFATSCKGGLEEVVRHADQSKVRHILDKIRENPEQNFTIRDGEYCPRD